MTRTQAGLVALVALVVTAGCGGSSSPSTGSSSAGAPTGQDSIATLDGNQKQPIVQAVEAYASATTPEQLCAVITRALEASIGSLGAAPTLSPEAAQQAASPSCPGVVASAVKAGSVNLARASESVGKVLVQRDRAAAMVKESGQERPYFLRNVSGRWLVNQTGTPPPDYLELHKALRS